MTLIHGDKILDTIKKQLGLPENYGDFDLQLIIFINTAFLKLADLNVNGTKPFICNAESLWSDFFKDIDVDDTVKTYIYINVKLLFDTPSSQITKVLTESMNECEWRLRLRYDDSDSE